VAHSPEQIALNNQIKDLPAITELANGQNKIVNVVKELSTKFDLESKHHNEELLKGEVKFAKIESKIADLEDTMNSSLKEVSNSLMSLKTELKDERIGKLSKQLDDKNTMRNALIVTVLTIIMTAIFSNIPPISIGI
jgi:uncharacterized protein YpmS